MELPIEAEMERAWCAGMLPKVSRTFALCIRLLPSTLEHPVCVAYLLCRIADTVEDSPTLSAADKAKLLVEFRTALGGGPMPSAVQAAFAGAVTDDEILTRDADVVLRAFRRLPTSVQEAIRPWVREMCDGMAEFALARAESTALF